MLVFELSILVVTLVVSLILFWKPKSWKTLAKIPGPRKLPLLGNSLDLNVKPEEVLSVLEKWIRQYGNRVFYSLGLESRVLLTNRDDIEKILSSNIHITKSNNYKFYDSWLGTGLLTGSGPKWAARRKLLTPAFHFGILEHFIQIINEQSIILIENLEKVTEQNFDILPYIKRCTLDIISETAMGTRINAQAQIPGGFSEYGKTICRLADVVFRRATRPWLHSNFIWRLSSSGREEQRCLTIIRKFANTVIHDRKLELIQKKMNQQETDEGPGSKQNFYTTGKKRLAFLDLLLEAQFQEQEKAPMPFPLTDHDIREEVDTFMFAGLDTTMANISWTLFLFGTYLDTQVKVQTELDSIFGKEKNIRITTQDLTRMKYLEACIKESLRIYPSAPALGRKLEANLILDDQVTIPTGTIVNLFPYFLHRDPQIFPDPENFLPERFFPENAQGRHPFAYVPFSAGPRNCVGQKFAMKEMKIILAQVLQNFNIKALEKREDVRVCMDLVIRPINGIRVKLSRRL